MRRLALCVFAVLLSLPAFAGEPAPFEPTVVSWLASNGVKHRVTFILKRNGLLSSPPQTSTGGSSGGSTILGQRITTAATAAGQCLISAGAGPYTWGAGSCAAAGTITVTGSPAANQTAYFSGASTITGTATDTTTTHALFATATAPAFRALVIGDLPATVVTSASALPANALVIGGGLQAVSATTANASIATGALTLGSSGVGGSLILNGAATGTLTIASQATAGTPTWTAGTSSGTPAVTASAPLVITTATGNATCPTCVTSAAALGTGNLLFGTAGTQASATSTHAFWDNSNFALSLNQGATASACPLGTTTVLCVQVNNTSAPVTMGNTNTVGLSGYYAYDTGSNIKGAIGYANSAFGTAGFRSSVLIDGITVPIILSSDNTTNGFKLDTSNGITEAGKLIAYNGNTLAGNGQSTILYANDSLAQVAAVSDTTMVTPGANTDYVLEGWVNCDTTSAAATATLNFKFTDTGSQAQTIASSAATCTALGIGSVAYLNVPFRAKSGVAVTWGVTIANTPTYDVFVRLKTL